MSTIKSIIDSIYPLGSKSSQEVIDIISEIQIEKGSKFIERGSRDQSEYFLIDGICRSFLLNPDGEEVTIAFYDKGTILSPNVIRTQEGISLVNFEALTDVTLGEMDAELFLNLMIQNEETRAFGNAVLRIELVKKVQKEINMASLNAKERLNIFREEYPGFENFVPHPAIASFLGITNVSLSRLRKDRS